MDGMGSRPSRLFLGRTGASKILSGIVGFAALGCGSHSLIPYQSYVDTGDSTQSIALAQENAYTNYLTAAQEFDKNLGKSSKLLLKPSFTPDEQVAVEKAAETPLREFKVALHKVCRVPYAPPNSEASSVGRAEWHLLAKVLVWRIQRACQVGSYQAAIQASVLATKFGFDMAAGLPNDASLGLITVDEARQALAPSIPQMTVSQLEMLSRAMKTVYLNRPSITLCYAYAEKDSLKEIQDIQDIYRSESYADLDKNLGSISKEITPILKELHEQGDAKRALFFDGLAQEAKNEAERLKEDSSLPVADRPAETPPKPGVERPWKRLSRRLLGIGQPIQKMNDATCAKTQLLILECQIQRTLKSTGKTPNDLTKFSSKLTEDPFSGEPFVYRMDGTDYRIYSVGEDLIDNDGETDESFNRPDMCLEKPLE